MPGWPLRKGGYGPDDCFVREFCYHPEHWDGEAGHEPRINVLTNLSGDELPSSRLVRSDCTA
jgi:hypothetical protein